MKGRDEVKGRDRVKGREGMRARKPLAIRVFSGCLDEGRRRDLR